MYAMLSISGCLVQSNQRSCYDVLIVGAGPVGMVAALKLTQHNVRVALLERQDQKTWETTQDDRTFAINSLGFDVLTTIKALPRELTPIRSIEVLDEKGLSPLTFQLNNTPLGYMMKARDLKASLAHQVHKHDGIATLFGPTISQIDYEKDLLNCTLSDGSHIQASFILAADGRNSSLRTFMNLPTQSHHFGQKALVGIIEHQNEHNYKAVELFTEAGPIAFLPTEGQRSAFVLSLKTPLAEALYAKSAESIVAYCRAKYPEYAFTKISGHVQLYPLQSSICRNTPQLPVIFIGDAATAVHPVAGQGLNLGIADVHDLADLMLRSWKMKGESPMKIVQHYWKKRYWKRESMLFFTNSIVNLFSNSSRGLSASRRGGLALVNKVPLLKDFFARQASGL